MIDDAHAWEPRTLENACCTLRWTNVFCEYGLPSLHDQLQLPSLIHPPLDISIPLFWSMKNHTTCSSSRSQGPAPSWNTAPAQRSVLSLHSAWTVAFCYPHNSYKDGDNRVLSDPSVFPSDNVLSRLTASGTGGRLGTESCPSQALSYWHVCWNQNHWTKLLQSHLALCVQYDTVAAPCA